MARKPIAKSSGSAGFLTWPSHAFTWKLAWKPLKAGRTGACTEVIERSNGNAALAQALLGHKDMATTTGIYKKQVSLPALQNGMKLLE